MQSLTIPRILTAAGAAGPCPERRRKKERKKERKKIDSQVNFTEKACHLYQ